MDLYPWKWPELKKEKEKTKESAKERAKEENGLQPGATYVEKVVDVDSKEKEKTKVKEKESTKESPRARTKAKANLDRISAVNAYNMDIGPETVPMRCVSIRWSRMTKEDSNNLTKERNLRWSFLEDNVELVAVQQQLVQATQQ